MNGHSHHIFDHDTPIAGFAAVDALVALVILSSTIAFSLSALDVARHDAAMVAETRQATLLLRDLVERPSTGVGSTLGHADPFDWTVEVAQAGRGSSAGKPCRRAVELRSLVTRRRYAASTVVVCPRPRGPQ